MSKRFVFEILKEGQVPVYQVKKEDYFVIAGDGGAQNKMAIDGKAFLPLVDIYSRDSEESFAKEDLFFQIMNLISDLEGMDINLDDSIYQVSLKKGFHKTDYYRIILCLGRIFPQDIVQTINEPELKELLFQE